MCWWRRRPHTTARHECTWARSRRSDTRVMSAAIDVWSTVVASSLVVQAESRALARTLRALACGGRWHTHRNKHTGRRAKPRVHGSVVSPPVPRTVGTGFDNWDGKAFFSTKAPGSPARHGRAAHGRARTRNCRVHAWRHRERRAAVTRAPSRDALVVSLWRRPGKEGRDCTYPHDERGDL